MRAEVGGHESHAGSASWSCSVPFEEEEEEEDPCMSFEEYLADRSPRTVRAHCATCEALTRRAWLNIQLGNRRSHNKWGERETTPSMGDKGCPNKG